jgi:2,3-dihydroxybenzoate-AMP ligase
MERTNDFVPWPDATILRYRALGLWREETFPTWLEDWTARWGERLAIVSPTARWTYAELGERVNQLASGLHELGLRSGDRAVVQLPNLPEFIAICFALFRLGVAPIFALPAHRQSEIAYLCDVSEAKAYFIADVHNGFDYRPLAEAVTKQAASLQHVVVVGEPGPFRPLSSLYRSVRLTPSTVSPRDVALFQLSGGTTGLPKLIPRLHEEYAYSVRASAELCQLTPDSSCLLALPMGHNFPMSSPGFLGTLWAGGKVVLPASASPEDVLPLIQRERVSIAAVVPPLALRWLEAAAHVGVRPGLGLLQVGGARLLPELARRITPALGCKLQQVFGMAEGLVNYTRLDDPEAVILETQGRPLSPADELRIVDEQDRPVAVGESGELLTRGPYTIRGYFRARDYNQRAFTADGFYRTGDIVTMTSDGNLVVTGRAKDQINRGGEKISAEELENHLLAHAAVRDVAVVAMPDAVLGERSCAFLVCSGKPPTLRELRRFLLGRGIADFKLPDRVEPTAALPRTAVGKIDKRELRSIVAARLMGEQALKEEV